jgi:hypothetical protein
MVSHSLLSIFRHIPKGLWVMGNEKWIGSGVKLESETIGQKYC